jgi:2-keto-4-pentenoate hydratase/2-oxohepta-3-ene-1,7-dioic acid hydratase in catechol pathway
MKLATFEIGGQEKVGVYDAKKGVLDVAGAGKPFTDMVTLIEAGESALSAIKKYAPTASDSAWVGFDKVKLLAPIAHPRKNVFCIGRNYKAHIEEMAKSRGQEPSFPKVPEVFTKPFTAINGHEGPIKRHEKNTAKLDYEVEFAIIIGKKVCDLTEANALDAVFGYTVFNDVTARDAQIAHGQWFKGKSYDTFAPMGPCIVTKDEFGNWSGKRLSLKVNGETRQDSNTSDLLFGVPKILEQLSASMTLNPGDVIATGTPSGVASGMTPPKWLNVGDVVEAEVEGIGLLRNRVVA